MVKSEFGRLNLVKSENLREVAGGNPFLFSSEMKKIGSRKPTFFCDGRLGKKRARPKKN